MPDAKKSFFPSLARVGFWLVAYVLYIFQARYAYKKCLLESEETFDTIWNIIRHEEVATSQEKEIFVDFKKMILRMSQNPKLAVQKSFFSASTGLSFRLTDYFLHVVWTCDAYQNCLLAPRQTSGTNLSIIRHVEVATMQQKAIFVDFLKCILRNSQNSFWLFKKAFFVTSTRRHL